LLRSLAPAFRFRPWRDFVEVLGRPGNLAALANARAPVFRDSIHVALQVPALGVRQHHGVIGRLAAAMEELEARA
jgi:hypothetical protein